MTSRPLEGLRVLDLSRLLPGPFATMVLADLGARVDKVEEPRGGDYLRAMPPHVGGMNATFHALNRGKRSLSLDLKSDAGREAFRRLVARYDVLVETFRPGVMERLGLGYDALAAIHPGLVYCAITGYGQDGPLRDRAGHDIDYLARAGALSVSGPPSGPTQVMGVQVADIGGGLYGVVGILAAIEERHRTGNGRMVDVSMCETGLAFAVYGLTSYWGGLPLLRGEGILMGGIAPYSTYTTKDDKSVALGALEPKFWMRFCEAAGIEPRMEALMPGPHQTEWKKRIADAIATKTRDEWARIGAEVDCCLEPVLEPDELASDEQHAARGALLETRIGDRVWREPRTPVAPPGHIGPAPEHGAHTDEILREAGLGAADIAALRSANAILIAGAVRSGDERLFDGRAEAHCPEPRTAFAVEETCARRLAVEGDAEHLAARPDDRAREDVLDAADGIGDAQDGSGPVGHALLCHDRDTPAGQAVDLTGAEAARDRQLGGERRGETRAVAHRRATRVIAFEEAIQTGEPRLLGVVEGSVVRAASKPQELILVNDFE